MMLAAVIALELHAGAPRAPRQNIAAAVAGPILPAAAAAGAGTAAAAWSAAILARPLFDPGRAPPAAMAAPVIASTLPRLAGILITPGQKDAVFAPAAGPAVIATEGGRIGPYTIREISRETVVVDGPRGLTVVHTSFAAGGAAPATIAPAPASPFSVIDGITGTPGGIWLDNGKADLPNAATWSGTPPLPTLPPSGAAAGVAPAGPSLTPPGA